MTAGVAVLIAIVWTLAGRLPVSTGATFSIAAEPLVRVLRQFGIPVESQVLVHSKTSLQRLRIDASNPRAIYFNDRAAVGWVPGSDLIEVAVFDGAPPGVRFLTIDASRQDSLPQPGNRCFQCHALPDSGGLPGLLMRSVGPPDTNNVFRCLGDIDDRTPYSQRWGGWYVTGERVSPGHRGRVQLPAFSVRYPRPGSDVVALLVLGHQVTAVNLINLLSRETRLAADDVANGLEPDAAALQRRTRELAEYLLFLDEEPLPAGVRGTSEFLHIFEGAGVRDAHGHSLRALDLQRHLFRVPCSYMIHSPAFAALPTTARQAVYARMSALLVSDTDPRVRARMSTVDRAAVVHILRETVPDLPSDFGLPPRRS